MSCAPAITILVLCLHAAPPVLSAENPSLNKKAKSQPKADAPAAKTNSIEALAALARPSVVVVSHYGREGAVDGVGTGFVVSEDGLIATCLHVIGEARPISVEFADGKRYDATVVHASDRKLDLALIRIDATNLPALRLGDSDKLRQGTPVVAMGNPRGLQHSVVQGVVSALREFDGGPMIQLAMPIEPGNSGGPLLDMQGRVHGLLTLKSALTDNLGFAMPVNALKSLLHQPNPVPMERWLTIGTLDPKQWRALFGARWSQRAGRIIVDGAGSAFGGRSLCLSEKAVPERPYELALTVKLDNEAGAAGLAFAADGRNTHYGFYPTAGQLRLTRFEGPDVYSWTILQQIKSPHYRPGDWNTIKVRVEKDKLLCFVNGEKVIESADTNLVSGKAGLVKFRQTKAEFKNFQLAKTVSSGRASPALAADITQRVDNLPPATKADAGLVATLQSNATASRDVLMDRARHLEEQAERLRQLASAVHRRQVQTELLKTLEGDEAKIDLFHAALLVAKLDNEEVDTEAYGGELDRMAGEIRARLTAEADDAQKLGALTDYLFVQNGYHGSRADYYNRANSYMNEVIDDREGIPLTLSILFMELGRRIGLDGVVGIPLPGHFIVEHRPKKGPAQLIDVYESGKRISRLEADELVQLHSEVPARAEDFEPATKRQIILRMLSNLVGIAMRSESTEGALRYLDVIVALSPESGPDRRSRALLRFQSGDADGAKEDLRWLLDHQPQGIDLERLEEILRSL
ncbi:MAG TPA: tetratricopeptide repeat protein [Verrucomicrobiae bacterium]|jgi:S1-C subfamily serine protease/regulator of sirC expression with transglutaminase-like and TPR domain